MQLNIEHKCNAFWHEQFSSFTLFLSIDPWDLGRRLIFLYFSLCLARFFLQFTCLSTMHNI